MRKIVVLAKQVPDTKNVGANAMKPDGTVNRAALPTIFNPEDLNALEMALCIKEATGMPIHVLSMGPPSAVAVLKHSLYMGADEVSLISDVKFAGADTLATSTVLAAAIKKIDDVAIVLCGRQAIDGDTAQVGPQIAQLLDFNLVAFVSKLQEINLEYLVVARDAEVQTEVIKATFPLLLTVCNEVNEPRYPSARKMLHYFRANLRDKIPEAEREQAAKNGWIIPQMDRFTLGIDESKCGLKGSPTKVANIKNITLTSKDLSLFSKEHHGIRDLVKTIMKDYTEEN